MPDQKVILTVDDNTEVLRLIRTILLSYGFSVQVATNGSEGLDSFHKHHDELCLVITDVTMPKMSGLDLAREIRKIDERLPVLLISGHYEEREAHDEFPMLLKPFSPYDLLNAVNSAVQNQTPSESYRPPS